MNTNILETVEELRKKFGAPPDFCVKEIKTDYFYGVAIFIDGLVDSKQFEETVVFPIIRYPKPFSDTLQGISGVISFAGNMREIKNDECAGSILNGNVVLICGSSILEIPSKKTTTRTVAEPPTNSVIKGPREGFVEDARTNMILIRKRIRTEKLKFERLIMGTSTETSITLGYIDGIADVNIVGRIKERLKEIVIDGILDSSYVTKIIENHPYSIFKQVGNSEKPDVICKKILDGKVVIIVEGSPIVLYLPFTAIEDFEDIQDAYKRPIRATFLRYTRMLGAFFALFLPALFVSVQIYQFQLLPVELLATVINVTGKVPFSPTLEMLIAVMLFEILGEASIRMPRHVGMAISVVGAIVLGETAVKAGLFSSITILVVAMSGIGIYSVPDEVGSIGILRVLFVIVAGFFGIYGILLCGMCIIGYMATMVNYGVPYLIPLAPIFKDDLKDFIMKYNLTDLPYRPASPLLKNKIRLRRVNK